MWNGLEGTIDSTTMQWSLLHLKPRLAIEIEQWTIIPNSSDTRLYHFYYYYVIENEAHFMLKWLLHYPIKDEFACLFEDIVLESLKSFFQLYHQVDISLYLT